MNRYLLAVLHVDDRGQRTSVGRLVERHWPSVPQAGQLVSLGGGDLVLGELGDAQFCDGWVRLSFLINELDGGASLRRLRDLGFAEPVVPPGRPALS